MAAHENAAAELLARYIEERKLVEGTDDVNFIACTRADPRELASLLSLSDELLGVLRTERANPVSCTQARAQLLQAIHADAIAVRPAHALRTRPQFRLFGRTALLAAALMVFLSIAALAWYSIWMQSHDICATVPSKPAVIIEPAVRKPSPRHWGPETAGSHPQ